MKLSIKAVVIGITIVLLQPTTAIRASVQNNCPFGIYASSANCRGNEVTGSVYVAPGKTYHNPLIAVADMCSQTVKISDNAQNQKPYQIEYNIDKLGKIWYDLSAIDGRPYLGHRRLMEIKGSDAGCRALLCRAGETQCEYPVIETCRAGDVKFTLC